MKRIVVLQEIFDNFHQMTQWVNHPNNYCKYHYKALSLVEFLEVEDCGSTGGFDREFPLKHITKYNLFDRFLVLLRKYNDEENISPICDFTVEDLKKYFFTINKLRDNLHKF